MDESYRHVGTIEELWVGCVVAAPPRLRRAVPAIRAIRERRPLALAGALNDALAAVNGFGIASITRLDRTWFAAGVRDRTRDVPSMSRRDHVWSHGMVLAVGNAISVAIGDRYGFSGVGVYLDPHDLTDEQARGFRRVLHRNVTKELHKVLRICGLRHRIRVREVKTVTKGERSPEAVGVWMADRLCYVAKKVPDLGARFARFSVADLTDPLRMNFERMGVLSAPEGHCDPNPSS